MSNKSKEFFTLVTDNKLLDAKKIFDETMREKISAKVTEMRKEVAKKFFNKTEK